MNVAPSSPQTVLWSALPLKSLCRLCRSGGVLSQELGHTNRACWVALSFIKNEK